MRTFSHITLDAGRIISLIFIICFPGSFLNRTLIAIIKMLITGEVTQIVHDTVNTKIVAMQRIIASLTIDYSSLFVQR